jgi:hypothetical protein
LNWLYTLIQNMSFIEVPLEHWLWAPISKWNYSCRSYFWFLHPKFYFFNLLRIFT